MTDQITIKLAGGVRDGRDEPGRPSLPYCNPEFGPRHITAQQIEYMRVDRRGRGHSLTLMGYEDALTRIGQHEYRLVWELYPAAREYFEVEPPERWRCSWPVLWTLRLWQRLRARWSK